MSANWRWTSSAVRPSHSVTCLTSRAHDSCSICSELQNCTSSSRNHIPQPHFRKQYSSTSLPEMKFCLVHVLITPHTLTPAIIFLLYIGALHTYTFLFPLSLFLFLFLSHFPVSSSTFFIFILKNGISFFPSSNGTFVHDF